MSSFFQARESRTMISERINFINHKGRCIVGVFSHPEYAGRLPCVVFAHGWDSGKDSPRTVPLSDQLIVEGICTLRIDLTGHGESEGSREESTAGQQTDDLLCAFRHLEKFSQVDSGRLGVHGASFGAIAAVQAATEYPGIRAVVLRGPRTDGLEASAGKLMAPILIIQGEHDPLAYSSQEYLGAVTGEKEMILLPGAGHLFDQTPAHLEQSIDLTVSWFKRWLVNS